MANLRQGFDSPSPLAQAPQQAPVQNQGILNRVGNFGANMVKGLLHPAGYFLNTDIVLPARAIAAQLTGNKTALKNANKAQDKQLTPGRLAGNAAQALATVVAPEIKSLSAGAKFAPKVIANAGLGGIFGAGNALASDVEDPNQILKEAALGGITGGAIGGATHLLGRVVGRGAPKAATEAMPKVSPTAPQVTTHSGPTTLKPIAAPVARPAPSPVSRPVNPMTTSTIDSIPGAGHVVVPAGGGQPITNFRTLGAARQASDALDATTMPQGWRMSPQGDVMMPGGKLGTLGDLQVAKQEPHLMQSVPAAIKAGDTATLQQLIDHSQGNSGWIRQQMKAGGINLPPPVSQGHQMFFDSAQAAGMKDFDTFYGTFKSTFDDLGLNRSQAMQVFDKVPKNPTISQMAVPGARPNALAQTQLENAQGTAGRQAAEANIADPAMAGKYTMTPEKRAQLIAEARAKAGQPQVTPKDYAKSAVSPTGPLPSDQSGGGQPQRSNLLQRVGKGLQKPATGATAPASPFGAAKEAEINAFLKKEGIVRPGSNSQSMYEALPGKFEEYQSQVKAALAKDNSTVNAQGLSELVNKAVDGQNHFLGSSAASDTVKMNVTRAIQAAEKKAGGHLTSSDIYLLKQDIQDELTRAYDKVAKGGVLTGGEDALMAARNAVNDFLPAEAKAIGQKQSMLYDAATGLNKARNEKARIPALAGFVLPKKPSKGLSHGIQSAGTLAGAPIEAAGDALAKIGEYVHPPLEHALSNRIVTGLATPLGISGLGNEEAPDITYNPDPNSDIPFSSHDLSQFPGGEDQGVMGASSLASGVPLQMNPETGQLEPIPQEQPEDQNGGITSRMIEDAMIQDLATTGGANLSKLNTIYSIISGREAQAKKEAQAAKQPSISQSSANQMQLAQNAIQGLNDIQAAFNSTTGTGRGLISKIAGRTPIVGNNVAAVNNAIRVALPSIAKSLGYGTDSAGLKALLAQLPSTSDTQKSAQIKLSSFQRKIEQALQQQLAIQAAYVQPDNTAYDQAIGGVENMFGGGAPMGQPAYY